MRLVFAVLLTLVLYLDGLAATDTDPLKVLFSARSLRCTFPRGVQADWDKGAPKIESATFGDPLHFDSLDIKAGRARFIGNAGSTDVSLWVGASSITFIETTGFGSFISTTVFAHFVNESSEEFIAVHSRHIVGFGSLASPFPSQYHGTCKRWE